MKEAVEYYDSYEIEVSDEEMRNKSDRNKGAVYVRSENDKKNFKIMPIFPSLKLDKTERRLDGSYRIFANGGEIKQQTSPIGNPVGTYNRRHQ